ncbi:MAG: hypothetical protein WC612_02525 [Bdellovibrionales bacterium]|jgi:hypothetical protein
MNPKRSFLLLVGDRGAFLLPPARLKKAHPVFAATSDKDETGAIMDELAAAPRVPVLILYDGEAQLYKTETLPPLAPWDRLKILKRRLNDAYEGHEHKGFLQHKNKTATLMAIQENAALSVWLERLAARSALSGFVSLLPMESAGLAARLTPAAATGWCFFLTQQKTGHTRFIAMRDGQMVFTRLTRSPPASSSAGLIASTIAVEIKTLRDYLARFGLTSDEPLTLVAVMAAATHEALAVTPMDVSSRALFTPHQAALTLGLPFAPSEDEPHSDLLHLVALAQRRRPTALLMKPETRRLYNASRIRLAGLIAMALMLALLLAMMTVDTALLTKDLRATYASREAVQRLETSLASSQAKATTGDNAGSLATLRRAVERQRLFHNTPPEIVALWTDLAPLMQDHARATTLDWKEGVLTLDVKFAAPTDNESDQNRVQADALLRILQEGLPAYAVTLVKGPQEGGAGAALSSATQQKSAAPKDTASFTIERKEP